MKTRIYVFHENVDSMRPATKISPGECAGRMLPACIRTAGPPVLSEPPRGDRNRMSCLQTSNCEARVRVYSLVSQRRRPHFAMRSSERAKTAQLCRTHTAQIRGKAALPPSKKLRFLKSNLARNTTKEKAPLCRNRRSVLC